MAGSKKDSESTLFKRSLTIQTSPSDFDSTPNKFITHRSSIHRTQSMNKPQTPDDSIKGKVKRLCSFFETSKSSRSSSIRLPGTEDRIVIYFTSLRGIRRTYEDCYAVRLIFRGFRVFVDERDVSMDSTFRKELESVLMSAHKSLSLPQVFIGGKYVGGVDAVKQLDEVGELAKLIKGFPLRNLGGNGCQYCGDVRFVPCVNCSGSRKLYDEDEQQLKRCLDCNENGLIRCTTCSS